VVIYVYVEDVDQTVERAIAAGAQVLIPAKNLASGGTVAALCFNLAEVPSPSERNPEYAAKLRAVGEKVGLPPDYVASLQ
jgi:hypothetical protein